MADSLVIVSSRDEQLHSAGLSIAGRDHQLVIHEETAETVAAVRSSPVDLVVLDARGNSGFPGSLVTRLRRGLDAPELLVLVGRGVDPEGLPAECCLREPVSMDQVVEQGRRLLRLREVRRHSGIVGNSAPVREVLSTIAQVAPLDVPVLVYGESGTGKELVARALHRQSGRRDAPFVSINVVALAESLLESELFGHEKGAFTGAVSRHRGVFERADGGTLFLDELGEMSPRMQAKLLRVLETHEFSRVGGGEVLRSDVRIVAATHRDLEAEMVAGRFRGDLYYRLKVVRIDLPPLRDRPDDILPLAENFLRSARERHDLRVRGWTREAMDVLLHYAWPGNVRELRNVVDASAFLAPGEFIEVAHLPEEVRGRGPLTSRGLPALHPGPDGEREAGVADRTMLRILAELQRLSDRVDDLSERLDAATEGAVPQGRPVGSVDARPDLDEALEAEFDPVVNELPTDLAGAEKAMIAAALRQNGGNRKRAAEQLGIAERTLYRKLRRYGLS